MEAAQLKLDEAVDVREQDGEIVIRPIRSGKSNLSQLLECITPVNIHDRSRCSSGRREILYFSASAKYGNKSECSPSVCKLRAAGNMLGLRSTCKSTHSRMKRSR